MILIWTTHIKGCDITLAVIINLWARMLNFEYLWVDLFCQSRKVSSIEKVELLGLANFRTRANSESRWMNAKLKLMRNKCEILSSFNLLIRKI